MATFTSTPVFYSVTWNNNVSASFNTLTGTQAGGLDPAQPFQYNQRISITGNTTVSSNVMVLNETIIVNGTPIAFTNTNFLPDIINTVNSFMPITSVFAHQFYATNCITFTNTLDTLGKPITLQEGNGSALFKLGVAPSTYQYYPTEYGTAFTPFASGDNISINGITITFNSTNGATQTALVSTINGYNTLTGVYAYPYGGSNIQLASTNHIPWQLGGNVVNIGSTVGNHYGYPNNLTSSVNKSQAYLRWLLVQNQLESVSSPIGIRNFIATGNFDGNADVTSLTFTVGYDKPSQLQTIDEFSPTGNVLVGAAAVKRFVSRGLASQDSRNMRIFDPTLTTVSPYAALANQARVGLVTASNIASNASTIETNLTVTLIPYT